MSFIILHSKDNTSLQGYNTSLQRYYFIPKILLHSKDIILQSKKNFPPRMNLNGRSASKSNDFFEMHPGPKILTDEDKPCVIPFTKNCSR